jgi:flagellin
MTSLLTNPAALTALQTLTQTMKSLQTVQNQISTGLRIGSAADNAAYWSIATTMRSDSSVLGTVSDALNMGSSTVAVASTALQKAISIMSKIKDDLASAAQPGVDRNKIQADITQQQDSLRSLAGSASFNGQNWLNINSGQAGFNYSRGVISSYSRDSTGAVGVGYIQVNIAQFALLDANSGNTVTAYSSTGLPSVFMQAGGTANGTDGNTAPTPPDISGTLGWNSTISEFTITPLGSTTAYSIGTGPLSLEFDNKTATLTYTPADGTTTPATPQNFTVTYKASGLLDTVDITTVGSYTDANGAVTASSTNGTSVSVMSMNISTLTDSAIDLATLNAYSQQVDDVIQRMTTSASDVGAVVTRIAMQQTFVSVLKDSIDTGVGSLVDADMNQESTRLQALQVQQQLGIQALSIANQSAQAVLKLFNG